MYPFKVTHVETKQPVAAITFDDGPHLVYTPRVLSILEKHGVSATFFMVGEAANRYPEIVKMVARSGHVIGNHAWDHTNLKRIRSRLHRLKQLWSCARTTAPYCTRLFRPPYGAHNRKVQLDALILGYKVILWNVSVQDWIPQGSEEIARKMIERVTPGSIVLLHDAIYRSHLPESETQIEREPMLEGLDKALTALKRQIRFVTVPELLRTGRPVYSWPR